MSWTDFVGLRPTEHPNRVLLPVTDDVTGGTGQLFGGVGLGAAIAHLEDLTGKPAAWATAQFLSNAFPPEIIAIDTTIVVSGHNFCQARAIGHVEGREVFLVMAALGHKRFNGAGLWRAMPVVPPPDACPERTTWGPNPGGLHTRSSHRMVPSDDDTPPGATRVWISLDGVDPGSTAGLAIAADFLPMGIQQALGREVFGASLDNTIRYTAARSDAPWVLADLGVDTLSDGVGHGTVTLWSPDGQLLAIASQTCSMREL